MTFGADRSPEPLDGRLVLMLSQDDAAEPRFQIVDGPDSQLAFGVDVEGWAPGEPVTVDGGAFGYPIRSLDEVPAGEYRVQALLNRYQTYQRADGHTVKLPPDRGEGQQWNRKPGNLLSTPQTVSLGPGGPARIDIVLDQEIPPLAVPPESEYVKHVKIQSELLTDFWGTPTELGAWVLVPHGFDEHPEARYPIAVNHGHFPYTFGNWREEPPDPDLECEYSARFDLPCYNRIQQEHAWQLHQDWTGDDFPRMLVVEIQHANPFYDDSYAVNSENLGPYGDAITYELIPEIERRFRGIGEGWARFLYGGSTGGWEAMAAQVLYPEDYNGAWIACPDPIDFRAFHRGESLRGPKRLYPRQRVQADPQARAAGRAGTRRGDARGDEPPGAGPRNPHPVGAAVGRVGSGLLAGGRGRVSPPHLGQGHRRDRPGGGRPLAGELRPQPHPAPRLGDPGAPGRRQA